VILFVYDISGGLAKLYSPTFIGKVIDGIWHTSIVAYDTEYFYGGGIQSSTPRATPYGTPVQIIELGYTCVPQSVFHDYLREVSPQFSPARYDLLKHNCNNFTEAVAQFLLGQPIPSWITGLPQEVMESPFGMMIKPMYEQMDRNMKSQLGNYYIDSEVHLPPVNEIYEEFIIPEEDEDPIENEKEKKKEKENQNQNQNQNQNKNESDVVMVEKNAPITNSNSNTKLETESMVTNKNDQKKSNNNKNKWRIKKKK